MPKRRAYSKARTSASIKEANWRQRFWARAKAHPHHYWVTAFLVFVLAHIGTNFVYNQLGLSRVRAFLFQEPFDLFAPGNPDHVRLVMIGDQDFWRGTQAGRRPLDRDLLADIVNTLATEHPSVIALDVDVRLPDPQKPQVPNGLRDETTRLIGAIEAATTRGIKVVLATPIANINGQYVHDPDIYQINGLCAEEATTACSENTKQKITCGYISLPYDPLLLPGPVRLGDDTYLNSFGLAIARAQGMKQGCGDNRRYSRFIPEKKFEKATLRAQEIMQANFAKDFFEGKVVIVGGNWHSFAAGRGPKVDQHMTPVGLMSGAMLHANYVEAYLGNYTLPGIPDWLLRDIMPWVLGLLAALLFAGLPKLWQKVVAILSVIVALVVIEWIMLLEAAIFMDAGLPIAALGLHSVYARLFEAWDKA